MAYGILTMREFIESHGHRVHVEYDGAGHERLVAECECVLPDGRVEIEYGAFEAPYDLKAVKEWLGY